MPYFEHEGARLHYETHGSGHPLLFLHGAAFDMGQWAHQVEYFSTQYRVLTLDARGHGTSTLPPGPVSPDIFWQDVVALLNHLGLETALLCGLSMGGHVALQTAIHAPLRVAGLILIGTPCTNRFSLFERLCVPINRFSMGLMPMDWVARCLCTFLSSGNLTTKAYIRRVVGSLDHEKFNRVWRAVTSMESRPGLGSISCPTLILIGARDSLTKRQQPFLHQSIPGSQLVTISNAHHATNLDNPKQTEEEISRFLARLDCLSSVK